jgi:glucose/arabinose dehydrogenase
MKQMTRAGFAASLLAAAFAASVLAGCGSTQQLFYVNKHTQAIERDTITASGGVTTFIQNPQDQVNGLIRLSPIESLNLQPVTLAVDAGVASSPFDQPLTLMVPPGFTASLYAYDLGQPRDLALRDDGTLFYSNNDAGEIVALGPDRKKTVLATGLRSPHGIELHNGSLYYTDETHVYRFDFSSPTAVTGASTMVTDKLPTGGIHYTRTIRWVPADKRFYIGVGSTTNKNIEDDNEHGAILRMAESGGTATVAMRGFRDPIGMDVHPETGDLWALDVGTELLSLQLPPDEINIAKVGKHYGWPFYYSQGFRDPDYMGSDTVDYPKNTVGPVIELEGHSSPSDLQFYPGSALGADWKNSMLVTCHGTSDLGIGFKVVRIRANPDGTNARIADFVTGFRTSEGNIWGTPVGIAIARDGKTFYISDDRAGAIYRISKP